MSVFDSFEKKHDYLVCVDSDGCVMDTMNCKHFHCFGPCMIHEWVLEQCKGTCAFTQHADGKAQIPGLRQNRRGCDRKGIGQQRVTR